LEVISVVSITFKAAGVAPPPLNVKEEVDEEMGTAFGYIYG